MRLEFSLVDRFWHSFRTANNQVQYLITKCWLQMVCLYSFWIKAKINVKRTRNVYYEKRKCFNLVNITIWHPSSIKLLTKMSSMVLIHYFDIFVFKISRRICTILHLWLVQVALHLWKVYFSCKIFNIYSLYWGLSNEFKAPNIPNRTIIISVFFAM